MTHMQLTARSDAGLGLEQPDPDQAVREQPGRLSRIRRRGLSAAAVAVVAVAALTSTATAASTTSGDFSSLVANSPTVRSVDNCTVELGPVFDSWSSSYRKIGGVRVNCGSVHSIVKATVWQQYWTGSAWANVGSSSVGIRYNQASSGYGLSGILRSPAVCGHAYFRTAALVQTEYAGAYLYSGYAWAAGC